MKKDLASVHSRIAAHIIDLAISTFVPAALVIVIFGRVPVPEEGFAEIAKMLMILVCLDFTTDFLNMVVLPTLTGGKTLGKAIMNIRIVSNDGKKLTFSRFLIRYLTFYLLLWLTSFFGYIVELAFMLKDKNRETLHDNVARTNVVNSKTSGKKIGLIWVILIPLIFAFCFIFQGALANANAWIDYIISGDWVSELTLDSEDEQSAVALIGTDGPYSQPLEEWYQLTDKEDLLHAIKFDEEGKFLKSKEAIDKAYKEDPGSPTVLAFRCYVYSSNDYEGAIKYCREAYNEFPNMPAVHVNISSAYFSAGECGPIVYHANELARIRIGRDYYEEKAGYYGTEADMVLYCDPDSELGKILLDGAIEYAVSEEERDLYINYKNELFQTE